MNDLNLVGMDYLWRVILHGTECVSGKAINLMKELHANLGPNLHTQQVCLCVCKCVRHCAQHMYVFCIYKGGLDRLFSRDHI